MEPSKSAGRLASLIQKAIHDHKLTQTEWNAILALADKDGHVDREEQALLRELHKLIESGAVERVP